MKHNEAAPVVLSKGHRSTGQTFNAAFQSGFKVGYEKGLNEAREAVKPSASTRVNQDGTKRLCWSCGRCGRTIKYNKQDRDFFCGHCGTPVMWKDGV